jgi:hypothetical protein
MNIAECSRYYSTQSKDEICEDDPPYRDPVWGWGVCKLPPLFLQIRHEKKVCGQFHVQADLSLKK